MDPSYALLWMQNWQWWRGVISLQADHSRIRHWNQSISSHNSPLFPFFSAYSHLPIVTLFHSETLAICPRLLLSPSYCVYLHIRPQSERLDSKTWESERDSQGQTVSGCLSFKSAPVVYAQHLQCKHESLALCYQDSDVWKAAEWKEACCSCTVITHQTSPQGLESSTNTGLLRLKERDYYPQFMPVCSKTHTALTLVSLTLIVLVTWSGKRHPHHLYSCGMHIISCICWSRTSTDCGNVHCIRPLCAAR